MRESYKDRKEERKEKKQDSNGRKSGQVAARQGWTLAASLVDARAADVPHPFDDVVVAVVELRLEHL